MIRRTNRDKRQIFMRGFWKRGVLLAEQFFIFFYVQHKDLIRILNSNENCAKFGADFEKNFAIKLLLLTTCDQCHLLLFFLSLCPGSWVWRPSPIPGSLMRLGTWPPTVCMIWLWGQQTTKRHVPSVPPTNLHTKLSWPVFSLFLNKHLFHFSLTRCVQPAARTSTTVQDTWDTWSSLFPCTTRCFSMWEAICTTHTQPNTLMFLPLFPLTGISNRATLSPPLSLCVFLCSDIKLLSIYLIILFVVRNSTWCCAVPAWRVTC